MAYEGAGLLWAARANALASTNLLYAELREGGPIPDNALLCARKLIWHEMQLGRVAHVLQWIDFAGMIASNQGLDSEQREKFLSEREAQDLALALLFLKADLPELMELRFLPDVLERFDLLYSRMALLYALGYEDVLRSEGSVAIADDVEVPEVKIGCEPGIGHVPIMKDRLPGRLLLCGIKDRSGCPPRRSCCQPGSVQNVP
jgi:hypothetical protein